MPHDSADLTESEAASDGPMSPRTPAPCGPPVDELHSFASWTIDAFVVVLWHFIAIIQPVLNHHLGRGAGEKDWAVHPAIVAPSETLPSRYLNRGALLTFESELSPPRDPFVRQAAGDERHS
jgi:hypothetical protein